MERETPPREITLRDYGRVLWSGRWLILATTVAAALLGLIVSVIAPTSYTATAQIFLGQPTTAQGGLAPTAATDPATAPEVLTNPRLIQRVAESAGVSPGRVRASLALEVPDGPGTQGQPPLATVTVTDEDRATARRIAEAYTERVLTLVSAQFEDVQGVFRSTLARTREDIERQERLIERYSQALLEASGDDQIAYTVLLQTATNQLQTLQGRATNAELQLATLTQFEPEVVSPPGVGTLASTGTAADHVRTAGFAGAIGLLVGVIVTFVWRGSPAGRARPA